jgi:hypothetical protein
MDEPTTAAIPAEFWTALQGLRPFAELAQRRIDLAVRIRDLENPNRGWSHWSHDRCAGQTTFDYIDLSDGTAHASCKAGCHCDGEDVILSPEALFDPNFEAGILPRIAEFEAEAASKKAAEDVRTAVESERKRKLLEKDELAQSARLRSQMGTIDTTISPSAQDA